MSDSPSPFRDVDAPAGESRRASVVRPDATFAASAYQPPQFDSAPPDTAEIADERPPRLSAGWAILLAQMPYYVALGLFVGDRFAGIGSMASGGAIITGSADFGMFLARAAMIGPGAPLIRVPIAIGCFAFAILIAASCEGAFMAREVETGLALGALTALPMYAFVLGLPFAALGRALGSRDLPRQASERPSRTAIVSSCAFAIVPALAIGAVFATGLVPSELSQATFEVVMQPFRWAGLLIVAAIAFPAIQTWRVAIRGDGSSPTWMNVLVTGSAVVQGLAIFAAVVALIAMWRGYLVPGVAIPPMFAVMIGREFFLRYAGYKATNLYLRSWRRRDERRPSEATS